MTIKFVRGDMFASHAEAIVNTVNCVGVMGKGVALEFKRRWPENFKAYKRACASKELQPGKLLIVDRGGLMCSKGPRYLINFPTKDHWRSKSKVEYIESGLDTLVTEVLRLGIQSLALPPLGCGNGGLAWSIVRPVIELKLTALADVDIEVYEPSRERDSPEYVGIAQKMTFGRAVYIKTVAALEPRLGGSVDRLSLQKIAYFLQVLGVPMNLDFMDSLYGPYSDRLKKSLRTLESWRYIAGYLEGDRYAHVTPAGFAAADEYLRENAKSEEIVEKFLHLVEGYDSPYGLELLSTLHYHMKEGSVDKAKSLLDFSGSTRPYRRNAFTNAEVSTAHSRLLADGLLSRSAA